MDMDKTTDQPATAEDQFDAEFAQLAAKNPASSDKPAATDGANASEANTSQANSTAATDAAAEQDTGKPAQANAAKPAAPGTQGESIESLRTQLAEALHRERSVANRISSVDSRSNTLARENADLKREIAGLKSAKPQDTQVKPGQSIDDVLSKAPELQDAVNRRIDEALAARTAPLQQALDAANAKLAEVGETAVQAANAVQPMVQRDAEQAVATVMTQLDQGFTPTWRQDVRTPEFAGWLNRQRKAVQDIYTNSVSFEDSASVLDLYYATKGGRPKPAASQESGKPGAGNPNPKPAASGQDRLREAAGIAPRSAAVVSTNKDDFDAAFAEAAALRAKQK